MNRRWVVFLGGSSDLAIETLKRLQYHDDLYFFVNYRCTVSSLDEISAQLGERIVLHQADLQDEEAVVNMNVKIGATCGVPDIFVQFAAPKLEIHRFSETSSLKLNSAFLVQTLSVAAVLRRFLPKMRHSNDGKTRQVIFLLSEVIRGIPPKGMTEYVVGKYALMGLMRALIAEFESKTLRIHSLTPGMMRTKFLGEVHESTIELAQSQRPGGLMAVGIVADKLAALIENPDALQEDDLYLR